MQIVIDIPDNYRSLVKSAYEIGCTPSYTVMIDISRAVANGVSFEDIKSRIKERADEEDIVNFAKGMLFALKMLDSEVEE